MLQDRNKSRPTKKMHRIKPVIFMLGVTASQLNNNYPKVENPRLEKLEDTGTIHNRLAIA